MKLNFFSYCRFGLKPATVAVLLHLWFMPALKAQGIAEMGAVYSSPKGSAMMNSSKRTINNLYRAPNLVPGQKQGPGAAPKQGFNKAAIDQAGNQSLQLWNQGKSLEKAGKLSEAAGAYKKALDIRERIWGISDPAQIQLLTVLGNIYDRQGKSGLAEDSYRKVLKLASRKYGQESGVFCDALANLAGVLFKEKKFGEAASHYKHLALLYDRKYGSASAKTINAVAYQADCLIEAGSLDQASALLEEKLNKKDGTQQADAPEQLFSALAKLKARQGGRTD